MSVAAPAFDPVPVRPVRASRFDSSWLLWIAIIAVLLFLVVSPFVYLVITSFQAERTGDFTLSNYATAYGRARYVDALFNSLKLGAASAALAGIFAVPLAWAVARTNMPGRGLTRMLVLATFITPPYTGAVAWILLAGPNAGWLNRFFMMVTGAEAGPFNIYSFTGLAVVIALYSFPYIFIFTTAALELVSSEMEDAANILGAGPWRTMRKVTLPLALPAILGGLIICFLEAIALFGSPAMIAIPARFNVVTTQLFQFFGNPVRVEVAAAYAMPLLGVTILLVLVQRLIVRRKGFVALTGKGGERRPILLGRWRWVMFGYAMFVSALAVFLPYIFLIQSAFAKAWGRGFLLDNITLANFHFILFEHATAAQSVINSFVYGGISATIAVFLTLGVAYIVARKLIPFGGVLGFLCVAPFVIPGVVLAIGFYAAYAPPPLSLYGTALILILAFTTRFLPVGYVNASAAINSLNPEMEEAVRVLGGSRMTALRRVVAPLLKRNLLGAWLLIFIPATRELSAAIFLYGPNTKVASVMIFDMSEEGNFERLAALALVLQVLTLPLLYLGQRALGRDFMLRRTAT
ncbi:iron ABC transporter permease [Reyranella sp. MMS21-HV4-11]|jgi:iron(III) transport system permease protein|uniref:Iron ABC transporter permease n=1 Tax=Reyranella humidisoli TaxID=2849149 RepID=A0ABS6IRH2_9HYPH|nr:iron ABC transporter permease [Reyranella sp. MMS21-HV4-11]MBU8876940.1 iron ABC transporter permease [Reyranella sp. MMS21-HV4-11]